MIGSKEESGYLKVDSSVENCDYVAPVTIDRGYNEKCGNLWSLKQAKKDKNFDNNEFFIEMTYGEIRPRLALEKLTTKSNQINLNVITRDLSD